MGSLLRTTAIPCNTGVADYILLDYVSGECSELACLTRQLKEQCSAAHSWILSQLLCSVHGLACVASLLQHQVYCHMLRHTLHAVRLWQQADMLCSHA